MTAIAKDRNTVRRNGALHNVGVGDGETIYAGTLCCYDSDGYLVDGADTAGLIFAGIPQRGVDNAAGDDGDVTRDLFVEGEFKFAATGLTADDVGQPLYLVDNQTVALAGGTSVDNYVYVGVLAEVISATECWVRICPPKQPEIKQYTIVIAGVDTDDLDLSTAAAQYGGSDFDVQAIQAVNAYVTSGGASAGLLAVTTNYTLTAGVIACADDQSANTLVIHCTAYLVP